MKVTTIAIKTSTKDLLASTGKKGQTFDELIQELLKKWDEKN